MGYMAAPADDSRIYFATELCQWLCVQASGSAYLDSYCKLDRLPLHVANKHQFWKVLTLSRLPVSVEAHPSVSNHGIVLSLDLHHFVPSDRNGTCYETLSFGLFSSHFVLPLDKTLF